MRISVLILIAALAGCAAQGPAPSATLAAARGTALAPPSAPSAPPNAPPQGVGAAGLDFGAWRGGDPSVYAARFQTQIRARYAGRSTGDIRTDLEANGFACEDGRGLDCRIEIMERQCAHDWYVVVEPGREPIAGFDLVCLNAR